MVTHHSSSSLSRKKYRQILLVCAYCQQEFYGRLRKNRQTKRHFCSAKHHLLFQKTIEACNKGQVSWSKGTKGILKAVSTSFGMGLRDSPNKQPVGTVQIRKYTNRPDRAWVKVAESNQWKLRAVLIWEQAYGPVPQGHILHHKDRNPLNDMLDNLEALTRAEHLHEHKQEFEEKRRLNAQAYWEKRRQGGNGHQASTDYAGLPLFGGATP